MNQEIISFLKTALECSILVAPVDPGLTFDEICEVGKRAGYQEGEIGDALRYVTTRYFGEKRLLPDADTTTSWVFFFREEPDFRNFQAFDFVVGELNALTKAVGSAHALIDRSVMVERAIAEGISRHDIEVAITYQVMSKTLTEKDSILRLAHGGPAGLPSQQLNSQRTTVRKPHRSRAFPIVKDVIERRNDQRPKFVEPFDAFAEELEKLGYGGFRLWWKQTVAELCQGNPNSTPVSILILSAALVEGALTFVVKHARNKGLGVFQSKDFDRAPRAWKLDDLVASAASGSDSAILTQQLKARTEILIYSRQRIHAGRMLADFPAGPLDLRPEEARDAKATSELVVRSVLDWLGKYPPDS